MKIKKEFTITVLCFGFLLFGAFALEAKAAYLTVTDTGDGVANYEGCYDGCTLREAMRQSKNGDTIIFASPLFDTPRTITLTSGSPLFLGNHGTVNVIGNNTDKLTISGNDSTSIFSVGQGDTLNIRQMTLTNGNAGNGGGGAANVYLGNMSMTQVIVKNCRATTGGVISTFYGAINIDHSTLYNNSSSNQGSVIYTDYPRSLIVNTSTISGNTSPDPKGAAIYLYFSGKNINIINSTITNNSANGGNSAGGIYNDCSGTDCRSDNPQYSDLYIKSSIIAKNPSVNSTNVYGKISSQSYSMLSGDPVLLPLADIASSVSAGIHFPVHAVENCSPVISAGDPNNTEPTDQLYNYRFGRVDIGAYESDYSPCPATITVTNNNDSGAGSLRQAVNDIGIGGTINFPTGGADIMLTSGQIQVLRDTNIGGGNLSYPVTIRGNNQSRIFTVPSGKTLNLSNVILADGNAGGAGGGAIDNYGTLIVNNSAIVNNTAQDGGGISNNGTLSMTNTTISGNRVVNKGAGIYNSSGGATAGVNYVTITNNRSDGFAGAGVWNEHFSGSNSFSARNSIIAGNISGNGSPVDYVGDLNNQGYNLINTTVPLTPLGNYGGLTLTHGLPDCASPALDAADPNNVVATDQRGFTRPFGGRADIGAFESTQSCSIVVQNGNALGYGTLDQALADVLDGGRISFAPGVNTVYTFNGLGIYKNVTINVDPANPVTIQSNGMFHVLYIYSGVTVNLTGLNFTGGNAHESTGGAIRNFGTLNASYINVYNNQASLGGGIFNNGTMNIANSTVRSNTGGGFLNNGTLTLTNSTVSGNTGGGILNSATLSLINSTVSGNQINGKGAGIYNNGGGSLAKVLNSTITDNRSFGYTGAGVWNDGGGFSARNSIIDGNFSDQGYAHDYVGGLFNLGNNLIGTRNPGLAPLGNYGGTTQTHALLQTSPAINAGDDCVLTANGCGDGNAALTTDERGTNAQRKVGDAIDIGAFERNILFYTGTSDGNVNSYYERPLYVTRESYVYAFLTNFAVLPVAGQSLPPGLNLGLSCNGQCGVISGVPTVAGTYNFTIKVTDPNGIANVQQFTVQIAAAPTAAGVSISGRVLTPDGRGLTNATVLLTDAAGNARSARTSTFGYYRFNEIPAGQTCVLAVVSKRYKFQPQVISVTEDLSDLNFTAQP